MLRLITSSSFAIINIYIKTYKYWFPCEYVRRYTQSSSQSFQCLHLFLSISEVMVVFVHTMASEGLRRRSLCTSELQSKHSLYLSRKVIGCVVITWVGFTQSHKLYNLLPHLARLNFRHTWRYCSICANLLHVVTMDQFHHSVLSVHKVAVV